MEIVIVPVILSLVYGIIEMIKLPIKNEKFNNFIPLIAGILGAILGVVAFYVSPMIVPTTNVFCALVIGLVSGLSATGSNQIVKQMGMFLMTSTNLKTENTTQNKVEDVEKSISETEDKNENDLN